MDCRVCLPVRGEAALVLEHAVPGYDENAIVWHCDVVFVVLGVVCLVH